MFVNRNERWKTAYDVCLFIATATLSWVLIYRLIPAVEFKTFYNAASTLMSGHSPYPTPGRGEISSGHAFVYPVTTLIYFIPYSFLPFKVALAVWRVSELLFLLSGVVLLKGRIGVTASTLIVVSSFALTAFQVASIEPLLLLLLVIAWRFKNNTVVSALALALAIGAKLFLLPLLLWLVLAKKYKSLILTATLLLGLTLPTAAFVPSIHRYYKILQLLSRHESSSGLSIVSSLYLTLHSFTAAFWITAALSMAFAAVATYLYRSQLITEKQLFGGIVIWSLLESPITWSHYYLLTIVPILLLFDDVISVTAIFAGLSWLLTQPDQVSVFAIPVGVISATFLAALLSTPMERNRFYYLIRSWKKSLKAPSFATYTVIIGASILLIVSALFARHLLPSLSFDLTTSILYTFIWKRFSRDQAQAKTQDLAP